MRGGQILPEQAPQEEKVEVAWPSPISPQKPHSEAFVTLYCSKQSPAHPDSRAGTEAPVLDEKMLKNVGVKFLKVP